MAAEFVHLHNHSDYSLLDGAASIPGLVSKACEHGMRHLALTDHGAMFGAMKFYHACRDADVNPIIGCEVYKAPESRHKKSGNETGNRYHHLVLLAKNETGYRNLLKLCSAAYTEGFYYRPRVDDELLEAHSEGLICLSACLAGEVSDMILTDREEQAFQRIGWHQEVFGKGNYYLELQDHGIAEQKRVNQALVGFARRTGIPLVATNDIHYAAKDDAHAQDVLICVGTNKKLADTDRLHFEQQEFYFKSPAEMEALFGHYPQALSSTLAIAEMCDLRVPLPGPIFPDYEVPAGFTIESYLAHISRQGLVKRYAQATDEVRQQLEYELKIISEMGFAGYFLIVWDFIRHALDNGIPVGPGRGSGAGSLVAYSLHITDIDPLKYGLLFERFLNPERVSMPDFDIDFCFERRGEVIDYVTEKYGKDKVGQIITFGTLKARAVVRDVARVMDLPYAEADAIAKLVPAGPKVTLKKALEAEPRLKEVAGRSEIHRDLIDTSRRLEGLSRHASTHAAGIVVGRQPLTDYVPLYRDPKTGAVSTQYTMEYLEECGLVKMDFLGLKTLTIIKKTVDMIRERRVDFDISTIPEDDPATFQLLGDGQSTCVFQFESSGMQGILRRIKPDSIEDLIALNSLYRPGPMQFIDQFVECKLGRRPITYPLPELEPVLKETYGVIVYQEQVMEIARQVAGFTLGQADILRRAMGKKKIDEMAMQKERFLEGAAKKGYSKGIASGIFDLLVPFAGYGFNKSHAAAYSVLAYQTAYLKANYPAEFMASNLTSEIHDTDKLTQYIAEARSMGIEILPPDINLSAGDFKAREGRIVYGLAGIKNVGAGAVESIVTERNQAGLFKNVNDVLERIDLKSANRKVVETLIQTGVLDSFGHTRATLQQNLDRLLENANRKKENEAIGQVSLFDTQQLEELGGFELEMMPEWPQSELLNYEKQNLGFFFSGHPLDKYRDLIRSRASLDLAHPNRATSDKQYTAIGMLREIKEILTRKGRRMAFATLEDYNASIELVIFPDTYEKHRDTLETDSVLAFVGKIDKERGEPKLLVDDVMRPEAVPEKPARAVHVQFARDLTDEPKLFELRDYLFENSGSCALYLHVGGAAGDGERVIQASPAITVSSEDFVLENVENYTVVEKVWTE